MPDILTALDIGGSKTCCVIARVAVDGSMKIIGASQQITRGIGPAGVVSAGETEDMLRSVISAAEKMAGVNINEIIISISGCGQRAEMTTIQQEFRSIVTNTAILRMIEKACRRISESGRGILHAIPLEYALDNAAGMTDPAGMYADEAAARVHFIDADMAALSNIVQCLAKCHIDMSDTVSASYASCLGVLTDCEKEMGALLVEFGGTHSTVSLFKDNRLHYTDTIEIGASHITKDIAIGLCTSIKHAERLKSLYGSVMPSYNDENETIEFVHREDIAAGREDIAYSSRAHLVTMISARVEEIVDILWKRMPDHILSEAASGIVLTGGGAALGGMEEYMIQRTGSSVRIGKPLPLKHMPDMMTGTPFAAVSGALRYAAYKQTMLALHLKDFHTRKGLFRRFKEWVLDNV